MASKWPGRNFYEVEFEYGMWFETAAPGGAVYPDSPYLMVSGLGDKSAGTEYARSALQFKTDEATWHDVGDISELNAVLWLYCDSNATSSGIQGIKVATISDPWDMSSNIGTMQGLATGAWSGAISSYPTHADQGWLAFPLESVSSTLRNANGIMLRCNESLSEVSAYRFLKDPAPIGRAFFQLEVNDTIDAERTERLSIPDSTVNALTNSRGRVYLTGAVILDDISPAESDVDIDIGTGDNLNICAQAVQLPESWAVDTPSRGSLTASKATVDLMDYRGYLMQVALKHRIDQLSEVTVGRTKGIIGGVDRTFSHQSVELTDTLKEAMSQSPYYRESIIGFESVEVDSEPRLYAMLMVLINGGGIPWSRFRQGDLVWLLRRAGLVWDDITVAAADLDDYTVGGFAEQYAREYGLCFSRGMDDSIVIWHPAWYRPSMEVWSVDDKYLSDVTYQRINATESYDVVTVGTGANPGKCNGDVALTKQIDGLDNSYTVSPLSGVFSEGVVKYGLARQLAKRLVQRREVYSFSAGARATAWEVGDKLKITSTPNSLTDTVFTITSKEGSPLNGRYRIEAVRWPDTPALQSTWQDTDIKGIYRLTEWKTGAATGVNQSPIGNGGDFTVTTLGGLSYIDWRGPVANMDITAPGTFFPTFSNYDLLDFTLAMYGVQDTDPYVVRDNTYTVLVKCQDSTPSDKAVLVYIKRVGQPNGHGGTYYPTTSLRIGIGYTEDYTADPIIWQDNVESAPGFGTGADDWIYGVAVQWYDDDVRLWIDREYVGSITALNTDLDDVDITTPVSSEHKIGCIRWLQNSTTWFDAGRLVGKPGEDNYYP